jgi:hypothetical protein
MRNQKTTEVVNSRLASIRRYAMIFGIPLCIGLGIALAITSTACFALLDTVSTHVGLMVPVVMAIWCRFAVQTIMTGVLLWPRLGRRM